MNRSPLGKEITKFEEDLFFSLFPAKEDQSFSEESYGLLSPPREISVASDYTVDSSFDEEPPISSFLNEDKAMGVDENGVGPLQTSAVILGKQHEQIPESIFPDVKELYINAQSRNSENWSVTTKDSSNTNFSPHKSGEHRKGQIPEIPKDWTGVWPKYIGSLLVQCMVDKRVSPANIMLNDEVTFKLKEIKFDHTSNQCYEAGNLRVQRRWNDQPIGYIHCDFEEDFALLVANKYLFLNGCIVGPSTANKESFKVKINAFLTYQVIENPINLIPAHSSRTTIKELNSAEINDAQHQRMRLSKSLAIVFKLLKIKISIPSLMHVQHDVIDQTMRLITSDFPEYYASNQDLFDIENPATSYYKEAETPSTLKSELKFYQKQALSWMLFKEGKKESKDLFSQGFEEQRKLNDLFQEMILIDGSMLYFNPFSGEISVDFPELKVCKGGILADEMGLGKTVMMIALMHANKREIQPPVLDVGCDANNSVTNNSKREADKFGMIAEEEYNISDEEEHKKLAKTKKLKLEEGYNETAVKHDETKDLGNKGNFKKIKKTSSKNKSTKSKLSNNHNNKDLDTHPRQTSNDALPIQPKKKAGTLIVVPLTVLLQWESEISLHSNEGTLTVSRYHGPERSADELQTYDVILTTYKILALEFKGRRKDAGLFKYDWHRIILDEAHMIKSRLAETARAACSLISDCRWCVTGTPLQNKLDDMFSLVKFLRMEMWREYSWWNTYVNKHLASPEAEALVRSIIKPILLMRTKKSTYLDGRTILQLPEKEIETQLIKLDDEERYFYNSFSDEEKREITIELLKDKTKGYGCDNIFERLIRLRQVCNHPSLSLSKKELKEKQSLTDNMCVIFNKENRDQKTKQAEKEENARVHSKLSEEMVDELKNGDLKPDPICRGDIKDSIVLKCGHMFCKKCFEQVQKDSELCSICQQKTSAEEMLFINSEKCRKLLDIDGSATKRGSKLIALQESIKEVILREEKCIIFSQFLGMLDLIQKCIRDMNIKFTRVDGRMATEDRAKYINKFAQNKNISVILISLKTGSIGLNLTAANNVFLVDPWWNPTIEDQAIDRVHRIGQVKKVNVKRFVCEKTIEEKVIKRNVEKRKMIKNVLHFDPKEQNNQKIVYVMQKVDKDLEEERTGLMDPQGLLSELLTV